MLVVQQIYVSASDLALCSKFHACPSPQDLDELQTHILLKRWVKDELPEDALGGPEQPYVMGRDTMLQVTALPKRSQAAQAAAYVHAHSTQHTHVHV